MVGDPLESAIYQELARVYFCTVDELSGLLSRFSPAQVATTVDRLIQEGSIACRSSDPSRTLLWLPPLRSGKRRLIDAPVDSQPEMDSKPVYEPADAEKSASFVSHL